MFRLPIGRITALQEKPDVVLCPLHLSTPSVGELNQKKLNQLRKKHKGESKYYNSLLPVQKTGHFILPRIDHVPSQKGKIIRKYIQDLQSYIFYNHLYIYFFCNFLMQ